MVQQCYVSETQQKTILNIFLDSLIVTEWCNNGTSKILNLLNEVSKSKFVIRKWNIANEKANANYSVGNEIIYNTEVLKPNLCD